MQPAKPGGRRLVSALLAVAALAPRVPSSSGADGRFLVFASSEALADDTKQGSRARELFREGAERFKSGDFRGALERFEQAYQLDPNPILVYNMARAHESLGDIEDAMVAYQHYLELDPNASDRGAVEQRIATLRRDLEERRALEQRALESERQRRAAQSKAAPLPRSAPPRSPSAVPWIIMGVGLGAVGAGVVLGSMAKARIDDAQANPNGGEAQDAEDSGRSLGTAANIAFVVGGSIAAGGLIAGVVDVVKSNGRPAQAVRAVVTLRAHGVAIAGRF
jgi:tetratricopeptide (TPR) repeat protein